MRPKLEQLLASPDFEADLLGGLMLASVQGAPMLDEVAGVIREDSFTDPSRRLVWSVIRDLARTTKAHDGIAVAARLRELGQLDAAGGYAHVVGLMADCASPSILFHRAQALHEYSTRRAVYEACRDAMEAVTQSSAGEAVAALSTRLDGILASGCVDAEPFSRVMSLTEARIERAADERKQGRQLGVPFGLPALDAMTGGMQPGELIGIAARTSIGKTAVATQFAVHAASKGHPGLIVTLEESPDGIGLRALANRSGLSLGAMRNGFADLDAAAAAMAESGLYDLPLWVDTRTFDLRAIVARIAQYRRKHRIAFAVVDHVGLVQVAKTAGQKRYEALGEVTRSLKQVAMQLGIPILALIQVGRDSEKESRRPMLSDLRESGNIEQDLNVCVALHPKSMPDSQTGCVPLEVGLIKNRYGGRGWISEPFEFHGALQQLRQIPPDGQAQQRTGRT